MKDGLENMDKLFRDNLLEYSQTPPDEVWNRIEHSLGSRQKRYVWPLYMRVAASILLLAGLGILTWKYLDTENKTSITEIQRNDPVEAGNGSSDRGLSTFNTPNQTGNTLTNETQMNSGLADNETPVAFMSSDNSDAPLQAVERYELPREVEESDDIPVDYSIESIAEAVQPETPVQDNTPDIKGNSESTIVSNDFIIQQNLLALEQGSQVSKEQRPVVWSLGGEAGPQYSYRNINTNTSNVSSGFYNEYEKGVIAYAGGVNIEMEPAKRFSVQSGVFYSKIGQIKNNLQLSANGQIGEAWFDPSFEYTSGTRVTDVVNSTGSITFDKDLAAPVADNANSWEPGIVTAEQYFEFIEVPLVCSYKIIDRKWDIALSSGLWANFLVGNKAYATDNETFTLEGATEDINKFNYSASLAVGFDYPVGKSLNISLQPIFKYYLMPINTNPQTEVYPYSFSLMTGIHYTF
jgi:hypothetical protein